MTGETTYANARVKALADFYGRYLQRKDVSTMNLEEQTDVLPVWSPNCYLMGLSEGDQNNNPNVMQTIGWASTSGGMGVFDPLSDNPVVQVGK